ncbi:MAG: hybrid sensor histidine kinase/response regulator [Granulosicoccus sp.]
MKKQWLASIPGLAALLCAAIMLYLTVEIDQTRKELQQDGVLEFNFIQQVDHNFDELAQALNNYVNVAEEQKKPVLRDKYILKYDLLYASIFNVTQGWLGRLSSLESAQLLISDAKAFLQSYEPLMSSDVAIQSDTLQQISSEARSLSSRVYSLGLYLFQQKSIIRDKMSNRMDDLYDAFWIIGASFLLATLLTITLLVTVSRRAADLSADAQQTQSKLTTALDELTSGDIERQAQNRFMAAASHDLRQPLHALGLYLAALKSHVNSEQGLKILDNTYQSTEALNQLLNSMLDLSKLDAGVVDVTSEHLSLDEIFERIHQTFLPNANLQNLDLVVKKSGEWVYSDRALLERVLSNLVSNALNYTDEGTITVSAQSIDDHAKIIVADTGAGIPESEHEAIFNEYYQLHNPERDRTKGLGLGLSIVKRLTRLLNIKLSISSKPQNGTQFELLVPAGKQIDGVADTVRIRSGSYPKNLAGLSILVIDDEHDVRDGMDSLLSQYQCRVVLADSIEDACAQIIDLNWTPDVIIADYRLRDEKTGDTAIQRVREEVNEDVPAMIITGDTSPERLREATASGFLLLHKPVIGEELLDAIVQLAGEPT